ncbi:MAG: glycerophosphodiester phosphodiesterase family protein, partial [Pseudomonadota bacterium]
MTRFSLFSTVAASLTLATTTPARAQIDSGTWSLVPETSLSAMLDCLEEADKTLISAHRGGPSAGLPENGIETMDAILAALPAIMEVDVAQSPDGMHYLMHDRTLDRTTTGSGSVADTPWSVVKELNLVD